MIKATIVGKRFGKRVVLARARDKVFQSGYKQIMLRMRCDCGVVSIEQQCNVKSGRANSCGCDVPRLISKEKTTHGFTKNRRALPIYASWAAMWTRCTNRKVADYKNYGGRGINVCRQWRRFETFLSDMRREWFPGATLERTNVNKGYSPKNCTWIEKAEQARNTRFVKWITFNGRTQLQNDWIKETGITSISYRLRNGWSVERALTIKP